jgi:catechol 2,3-dioxygenase-like lactoylglutathione lyase family enzyme
MVRGGDTSGVLRDAKIMAFVATADPERATTFYRDVLGLRLVSDERFAVVFDAGGTMLRIQKMRDLVPQPFTALGWEVDDLEHAVDELIARGASPLRAEGLPQDARGIWQADATTKVWWTKDPDGNTLSLTQLSGPR